MESIWRQQRPPSADLVLVLRQGYHRENLKIKKLGPKTSEFSVQASRTLGSEAWARVGSSPQGNWLPSPSQEDTFSHRWGAHMSSAFPQPFAKHTVTCQFCYGTLFNPFRLIEYFRKAPHASWKGRCRPTLLTDWHPLQEGAQWPEQACWASCLRKPKATLTIHVRRPSQAGTKREPL